MDILASILGASASLLAGGLVQFIKHLLGSELGGQLLGLLGRKRAPDRAGYSEKLNRLSSALSETSREFDALLRELTDVARAREQAVQSLEANMKGLEAKERELQERIKHLENLPLPVADYLASLTAAGEKRSARRDYLLFAAGVVVSTVIAIILRALGLA